MKAWAATVENRLMTERQVEHVALASKLVANRRVLSPLQDCAADQVRVVALLHRGGRRWAAARLAAPVPLVGAPDR